MGVELFDRSERYPRLTLAGTTLPIEKLPVRDGLDRPGKGFCQVGFCGQDLLQIGEKMIADGRGGAVLGNQQVGIYADRRSEAGMDQVGGDRVLDNGRIDDGDSGALADKSANCRGKRNPGHNGAADACLIEVIVDEETHPVAMSQRDEALPRQFLHVDPLASSKPVIGGHDDNHLSAYAGE